MSGSSIERLLVRKSSKPVTEGFRDRGHNGRKIAVIFPDEMYTRIRDLSRDRDCSFASAVRILIKAALEE